jgi:integrase
MTDMSAPAALTARDRILSDDELVASWHASGNLGFPFGPMFRLLIATGQRREEVAGMDWSEIDFGDKVWTIPAVRSKNRLAHIVPLNALALDMLSALPERPAAGLVFSVTGKSAPSGWSKAKARLDALMIGHLETGQSLVGWRTHDLRRTVATGLQRLGVRFEVTEAVLNHVSGARAGVAGVYQRHNWAPEKRQALDRWGQAVHALVSGVRASLLPEETERIIPISGFAA